MSSDHANTHSNSGGANGNSTSGPPPNRYGVSHKQVQLSTTDFNNLSLHEKKKSAVTTGSGSSTGVVVGGLGIGSGATSTTQQQEANVILSSSAAAVAAAKSVTATNAAAMSASHSLHAAQAKAAAVAAATATTSSKDMNLMTGGGGAAGVGIGLKKGASEAGLVGGTSVGPGGTVATGSTYTTATTSATTAAATATSSLQENTNNTNNKQQDPELKNDENENNENEEEEESSEISASDEDGSWISWFCSLRGNEFFCEVDEDYIQDDFNLTGLNIIVPYYDYALDMVLDVEMPMEESLNEHQQEIVESAAVSLCVLVFGLMQIHIFFNLLRSLPSDLYPSYFCILHAHCISSTFSIFVIQQEMLYGLIHARYIVTNRGMHAMYEKYRSASFGRCPHVFCQGQPVLPVGLSDLPRNYTVNVFCPRCHGLFFPKSTRQANIDGAYFGTTFPHLYLMTHPDMIPTKPNQQYHPRVYGFKINQSSLYYRNHEESPHQRNESGSSGRSNRRRNNRTLR